MFIQTQKPKGSSKVKKKYLPAVLFCIIIALGFCSCSSKYDKPVACREIITALTEQEINLPAGILYSLNISEGEDGYISEDLLCALYGYGKLPEETKSWIDVSFYISSRAHPCEFAAVLCNSPSAAQDTAKLFCKRLDTLKNSWNNDELSYYLKNAEVVIIKNYVLLLVSADSENAKSIASEIIR